MLTSHVESDGGRKSDCQKFDTDEKQILQLYSRDVYLEEEAGDQKPDEFRRRQSVLYNKMHPVMVNLAYVILVPPDVNRYADVIPNAYHQT